MNRRDVLKGMLVGLTAPRLLTDVEAGALDVEPSLELHGQELLLKHDPNSPTWTSWAVPADTLIECPRGIAYFQVMSSEEEDQPRYENVTVETLEGLTYLDVSFNSWMPMMWYPPGLDQQIYFACRIKVSCPAVIQVRSTRMPGRDR